MAIKPVEFVDAEDGIGLADPSRVNRAINSCRDRISLSFPGGPSKQREEI